nr:hypothetical protein [uncultured Allomuricauda sp.]
MVCSLDYIPEYLHTNDKPIVENFSIGEKLFYRCKSKDFQKPYDNISLYDISHNRNFGDSDTYKEHDVLFNIVQNDSRKLYEGLDVVVLNIQNIEENSTYLKEIVSKDDPKIIVVIQLKHAPVPCMYPHSVFEISLNGTVIDNQNYSQSLGKKNVTYKNLRSDIRQELTSIIQTGNIDSSKDIEFIDEP